ncbi:MAG: molybdopterin molybdotransferase MoeA, partial [Lysinibacillus sp.]
MVQLRTAMSIGEAISKTMIDDVSQPTETVALTESMNRFLADDLVANENVPAFDRALYDGYAIRAEDTMNATDESPVVLEVIETVGAGFTYSGPVKSLQAVRIMTGAEIPSNCNAVIMLEDVREFDDNGDLKIVITHVVASGERVFKRGSELKKGATIALQGTQITPGLIGMLATFGFHKVSVKKKPVVGVIATGSELLNIDEPIVAGKIRNSNSYMLMSQIEQAGGEAVNLGKLEDNLEKSIQAIKDALPRVDILITTGGVSVGDFDYLPSIYERLNATVLFNKIAMRPGSVTTVAKL